MLVFLFFSHFISSFIFIIIFLLKTHTHKHLKKLFATILCSIHSFWPQIVTKVSTNKRNKSKIIIKREKNGKTMIWFNVFFFSCFMHVYVFSYIFSSFLFVTFIFRNYFMARAMRLNKLIFEHDTQGRWLGRRKTTKQGKLYIDIHVPCE